VTLRTDIQYFTPDGRLTQAGFQAFGQITTLTATVSTLQAKIAAAAAIANAAGGATIDTEARAQLAAVRSALT
jgi:hypothetical protein